MSIIVIGIDLAKNIFAVHGMNESGRAELVKPKVSPVRSMTAAHRHPARRSAGYQRYILDLLNNA